VTLQGHCEIGCQLFGELSGADDRECVASSVHSRLRMAAVIAGCHHERWGGGGYPNGLQGPEIPLEARLVAVADVYDALREPRPYRPGLAHEEAVTIMGANACGDFDPEVFAAFLACQNTFQLIHQRCGQ
jgi:putative two-component system response regulator